MKYTSHFFIPHCFNFTIDCTDEEFAAIQPVNIVEDDDELNFCFTDDEPQTAIGKSRRAKQNFKRKYRVCDETDLVTDFKNCKDMMLYYTGIYDRNLHYSAVKHFINTHLLSGRKALSHIWRYTIDGQEVEI